MAQTKESIQALLDRISYRDIEFLLEKRMGGFLLQVQWEDTDNDTGELCKLKGAKHYISAHATDDEVVKRCWVAVMAAITHEAMEEFKLDGVAPFNPHNDVFSMLDLPKTVRVENNPEVVK